LKHVKQSVEIQPRMWISQTPTANAIVSYSDMWWRAIYRSVDR